MDDYAVFTPLIRTGIEIVYGLTAAVAFIGNLIVICVLMSSKSGFSRVTRKFILNLAISDCLLAIISIPFTYSDIIYVEWKFPLPMCYVAQYGTIASLIISVLTLLVIAIDRYFSICRPTTVNYLNKYSNALVAGIWIFALSVAAFQVSHAEIKHIEMEDGPTFDDCRETWPDPTVSHIYTGFIFLLTYAFPGLTMGGLYWSMVQKLKPPPAMECGVPTPMRSQITRSSQSQTEADQLDIPMEELSEAPSCGLGDESLAEMSKSTPQRGEPGLSDAERARLQRRKKVIHMLMAVVLVFFLCWTPIQFFNLILWLTNYAIIPEIPSPAYNVYVGIFLSCHWLSMANSCLNPIIYCFMSDIFREDLRRLYLRIFTWLSRQSRSGGGGGRNRGAPDGDSGERIDGESVRRRRKRRRSTPHSISVANQPENSESRVSFQQQGGEEKEKEKEREKMEPGASPVPPTTSTSLPSTQYHHHHDEHSPNGANFPVSNDVHGISITKNTGSSSTSA